MIDYVKQFGSLLGTVFAGACCLGVAAALSVLTAVGAGFLANDAVLLPLFYGLMALSLWLLYGTSRRRGLAPFWLGAAGAVAAGAGLWIAGVLVWVGLAALIAGSVWDFARGRESAGQSSA